MLWQCTSWLTNTVAWRVFNQASRSNTSVHHTQLVDMFVEQTHDVSDLVPSADQPLRFTDTRLDEQQRLISVKMMPVSLVMPSTKGKSYLLNFMDTPGAWWHFVTHAGNGLTRCMGGVSLPLAAFPHVCMSM